MAGNGGAGQGAQGWEDCSRVCQTVGVLKEEREKDLDPSLTSVTHL